MYTTSHDTMTPRSTSLPLKESEASMTQAGMVTGLFPDRVRAEQAYHALSVRGYDPSEVNVLMSDETRQRYFGPGMPQTELGNKAAKGAGIGAAIGGTVGAVAAAVAAIGTALVLPGIGWVVAGPLAAALAGAGAGGAAGTLIGALVGAGIPEERIKRYESGIRQGGILIGVRPHTAQDAAAISDEWERLGAEHVHH